jgi:hypothetical protein
MADAPRRYVLWWLAWREEIERPKLTAIRRKIEDLVVEPPEQVEIDVWLESPGGDAHVAYKLALMLRDVAGYIRVVVPDYAKSAATLLALVGDDIYMAPGAELGPLDAQMPEEGSLSGAISSLNIAHAADAVAEDAVALAGTGGAQLLRRTGLSRAETLSAMLAFSAKFSEPLVRQLNPTLVHQAKELLRVTARYAERLLEKTRVGQEQGDKGAHIAKQLVENFPTHGFVIAYDDAKALGLPVKPIAEYDLLGLVRPLHRLTEDNDLPCIDFMPLDELLKTDGADSQTERENPNEGEQDAASQPEDEGGRAVPPRRASRKRTPKAG